MVNTVTSKHNALNPANSTYQGPRPGRISEDSYYGNMLKYVAIIICYICWIVKKIKKILPMDGQCTMTLL